MKLYLLLRSTFNLVGAAALPFWANPDFYFAAEKKPRVSSSRKRVREEEENDSDEVEAELAPSPPKSRRTITPVSKPKKAAAEKTEKASKVVRRTVPKSTAALDGNKKAVKAKPASKRKPKSPSPEVEQEEEEPEQAESEAEESDPEETVLQVKPSSRNK